MEISRRAFIHTGIIAVWGLSAFAFDVAPLYAQATTLKIAANALDGRRHG